MNFSEADDSGGLAIRGYGPGHVQVGDRRFQASLIVTPRQVLPDWPPRAVAELSAAHLARVLELDPEILLLGTGPAQVFPDPALLAALWARRIGLEVMDTPAACRTYNILMSEGRRVAAALILP